MRFKKSPPSRSFINTSGERNMKLRLIGAILVGAAVAAWACKGDPTADLRNGAAALSVTPSIVVVDPGTIVAVTVEGQDAQFNPLIGDVTASTSDATLATVEVDASRHFPDASTHAFNVTTVGLDGGQPLINFATGSVTTPLVVSSTRWSSMARSQAQRRRADRPSRFTLPRC